MIRNAFNRREMRPAAYGNQDAFGGVFALPHPDRMRPGDNTAPGNQLNPGIIKQVLVDTGKTVKFSIFAGNEAAPVMTPGNAIIAVSVIITPAKPDGILYLGREEGAKHQQLFGNTAPQHAGAAGAVLLNHGDFCAMASGDAAGPHSP